MSTDGRSKLVIFGRDLSEIPCYRNSLLYGISSGIGAGLIYFLFTSKPKKSTNFGMGSFGVITIAYWIQCRYRYFNEKFLLEKVQKELMNRMENEHLLPENQPKEEKKLDLKTV